MTSNLLSFDPPKKLPNIVKIIGIGQEGSIIVRYLNDLHVNGADLYTCDSDENLKKLLPVRNTDHSMYAKMDNSADKAVADNIPLSLSINLVETREQLKLDSKLLIIVCCFQEKCELKQAIDITKISRELGLLTLAFIGIMETQEHHLIGSILSSDLKQLEQFTDSLLPIIFDTSSQMLRTHLLNNQKAGSWILAQAAKSIIELVTVVGYISMDFEDIREVLQDSGVMAFGMGMASGPSRLIDAIAEATHAHLFNEYNLNKSNDILLHFSSGSEEITIAEITEACEYIRNTITYPGDLLWTHVHDKSLGDAIRIIIFGIGINKLNAYRSYNPKNSFYNKIGNSDR